MRVVLAVLLAACMLVSAVGCGSSTPAEPTPAAPVTPAPAPARPADPAPPKDLGSIVVALRSEPATLNLLMALGHGANPRNAGGLVSEPLFHWDYEKHEIVPGLAESWEFIDDTTLKITVKQGIEFSNGEPLNAEAVGFSLEQLWAEEGNGTHTWESIEVVDEWTVLLKTKAPYPLLVLQLSTNGYVVPPRYYAEVGNTGFGNAPIGTGKFLLHEWRKGEEMVFVPNPDYRGEQATIGKIIIKEIPEIGTMAAALETGEVDVITDVALEMVDRLDSQGHISVHSVPGIRVFQLPLDRIGEHAGTPTQDSRVALALNHAVDRQTLLNDLYGGYGEIAWQVVTSYYYGFNHDLPPYTYDVTRAKQLLAEAGYPNGFDIAFDAPQGLYTRDKELCEAIADHLSRVDIRCELSFFESGTFLQRVLDRKIAPIHLLGRFTLPDAGLLLQSFVTGHGFSRGANERYDLAVANAGTTMDPAKRLGYVQEALEVAYNDPPVISLFAPDVFVGVQDRVQGLVLHPGNVLYYHDVSVKD